ncbi:MAG: hypothetical protein KGL91_00670 [Xanthomonadaceae bacterium]|nr:hypothetical protein [Xanthomonadaceae bacterium]
MSGVSPRFRLQVWLLLAGLGLVLFFSGEYRDLPLPLDGLGMLLFVAAVWFAVAQVQASPRSEAEAQIAPGEWQAWVGLAFSSAVIAALLVAASLFQAQVPIGHNPDAVAAGKRIGTLFVAWVVLAQVLKRRWGGQVQADERDAQIELVAGQWARCVVVIGVVALALLLGFSETERLRDFSYPFIAHLLMLVLLGGLWSEQWVTAILYRRDRRGVQA